LSVLEFIHKKSCNRGDKGKNGEKRERRGMGED
jgi:hypothetical protein